MVKDEKFRKWASASLEVNLRAKNPQQNPCLAATFTRYMHYSNLYRSRWA
jgi:hypothetical protein